jgi:hypothetical protein
MWATSVELNVPPSGIDPASVGHSLGISPLGLWFEDEEEDEEHTFGIDPASGSASIRRESGIDPAFFFAHNLLAR